MDIDRKQVIEAMNKSRMNSLIALFMIKKGRKEKEIDDFILILQHPVCSELYEQALKISYEYLVLEYDVVKVLNKQNQVIFHI